MAQMNQGNLADYLKLCRRLGVRYLSLKTWKVETPAVVTQTMEDAALVEATSARAPTGTNVLKAREKSESVPLDRIGAPPWLTASSRTEKARRLAVFDAAICGCQKCPLGGTRKNFVFGSGNPEARVMFVGEAPGADEDAQGLPFVGRAGQLLTKIIESTKAFKRQDVFIANVLKCRPPENRVPLPAEVDSCRTYLEEQIKTIQPLLIMALGASAAQALLKTKDSVGKLRGRWHDLEGIPLLVTYHPAALLRTDTYKKDVWEDMKTLTQKFVELSQNQG